MDEVVYANNDVFNDLVTFFEKNKDFLKSPPAYTEDNGDNYILFINQNSDIIIFKSKMQNENIENEIQEILDKEKERFGEIKKVLLLKNYQEQDATQEKYAYTNLMIQVYHNNPNPNPNSVIEWSKLKETIKRIARSGQSTLNETDDDSITTPLVIKYYENATDNNYKEVISIDTKLDQPSFTLSFKISRNPTEHARTVNLYDIVNIKVKTDAKTRALMARTAKDAVSSGLTSVGNAISSGLTTVKNNLPSSTDVLKGVKDVRDTTVNLAMNAVTSVSDQAMHNYKLTRTVDYTPKNKNEKQGIMENKFQILTSEIDKILHEKRVYPNNQNLVTLGKSHESYKLAYIFHKINMDKQNAENFILNNVKIVKSMLSYNLWNFPAILEYIGKNNKFAQDTKFTELKIYEVMRYTYFINSNGYIVRKNVVNVTPERYIFDLQGTGFNENSVEEAAGNGPEEDYYNPAIKAPYPHYYWGFQYNRLAGAAFARAANQTFVSSFRDNIFDTKDENVSQNRSMYLGGGNRKTRKHCKNNNNRKTHKKINKTKNNKIRKNYRKTRK